MPGGQHRELDLVAPLPLGALVRQAISVAC
jgi:hypothetical protein